MDKKKKKSSKPYLTDYILLIMQNYGNVTIKSC